MFWLNLIGLLLGIAGTLIIIRGQLTTSAAQIKHLWKHVNESWQMERPSWFRRFTCHIAKKFGSDQVLDANGSTVEEFYITFWGFALLFLGFMCQLTSILIEAGVFQS